MNQNVYNIAVYNDQSLDTWSDIIVSFEYERFSFNNQPTGGFALVFFDDTVDMPRDGGPGTSLGYAPSTEVDYCKQGGFAGLQAAFLGIGFDNKGLFAASINGRSGIPVSQINNTDTLTVRGGVSENFNVLKSLNLKNTLSGMTSFTVDQSAQSGGTVYQRAVRVLLKNHATKLIVQVKDALEKKDFDTALELDLPEKIRRALKVGITNTADNGLTYFNVKSFNVAGFPGVSTTQKIDGCSLTYKQPNYGLSDSRRLCVGDEFIVSSLPNQVVTYTTDTTKYNLKNIIFTGSGIQVTSTANNNVGVIYEQLPLVGIYKYLGEKLSRNFFITPPDGQIPKWVDIDKENNSVAILTRAVSGAIHLYDYISTSDNPKEIGTWKLYQTIDYNPFIHKDSGFLSKVKIDGRNLAVNAGNEKVHMYRKNVSNVWTYAGTLTATIGSNFLTGFGDEIAIDDDNLLIGAPLSQKIPYPEPVQGEVYHYTYSKSLRRWDLAMAIGSFFNLNTPLGAFGTSIDFKNNTCIIGSPGEEYRVTPEQSIVNVGRVHIFRKAPNGVFSQRTSIAPEGSYILRNSFFGSSVALFGDYWYILAPFTPADKESNVTILDSRCVFQTPPPQINIPACAFITFDNRAFILDTITDTYMISYICQTEVPE